MDTLNMGTSRTYSDDSTGWAWKLAPIALGSLTIHEVVVELRPESAAVQVEETLEDGGCRYVWSHDMDAATGPVEALVGLLAEARAAGGVTHEMPRARAVKFAELYELRAIAERALKATNILSQDVLREFWARARMSRGNG